MDRWDVIILLVAGYMAVMALVRMMARRRNQIVGYVREKIAESRGTNSPAEESTEEDKEAA